MPGLLRGVARVAVASGTATAVSNRVSRRQSDKWASQGQSATAYLSEQPPPAAPAAAPAPARPRHRARSRSDPAAEVPRRAAPAGRADGRGVRRPESQAARLSRVARVGLSQLWRVVVVLVITAGALMLLSALLAGFYVDDFEAALVSAAGLGLI